MSNLTRSRAAGSGNLRLRTPQAYLRCPISSEKIQNSDWFAHREVHLASDAPVSFKEAESLLKSTAENQSLDVPVAR